MPTLLARNADMVVTMDDGRRELPDAGLFVRDGMIEQVGPTEDLPRDADVVLDLTGQILLPGFVNTHHHLDQTLTRALPAGQDINLFPWLRAHYEIWARRTPRGVAPVHARRPRRARRVRLHDGLRSHLHLQER